METTTAITTLSTATQPRRSVPASIPRRLGEALLSVFKYSGRALAEPTVWNAYWMFASPAIWRSKR